MYFSPNALPALYISIADALSGTASSTSAASVDAAAITSRARAAVAGRIASVWSGLARAQAEAMLGLGTAEMDAFAARLGWRVDDRFVYPSRGSADSSLSVGCGWAPSGAGVESKSGASSSSSAASAATPDSLVTTLAALATALSLPPPGTSAASIKASPSAWVREAPHALTAAAWAGAVEGAESEAARAERLLDASKAKSRGPAGTEAPPSGMVLRMAGSRSGGRAAGARGERGREDG